MPDQTLQTLGAELENAAESVRETHGREQLRKRVESVAAEFSRMAEELQPASDFLRECVESGIIDAFPEVASDLTTRLLTLADEASNNPEKVVDADDLGALRSRINNVRTRWETAASAAWRDYCARSVPARQEAILGLLQDMQGPTDALAEIQRLDRVLAQLSASVPLGRRGGPRLLVKTLADRRELWNSLDVDQIPDEVMAFINATATGAAPLRLVTPEIQEWLRSRGLLDNYSVVGRQR